MADDDWWPMQILIKCPNQIVRQVRKNVSNKMKLNYIDKKEKAREYS